tara:strand:- start:148 stop:402 length:255 start_codon:yes stop_codon:yes gene_type:complete
LAEVFVTLKPTVNDPPGITVMGAVQNLGFNSVVGVRIGKFLEIRLAETNRNKAEKLLEDMCQKLLANPVIEEYRYELKELSSAS